MNPRAGRRLQAIEIVEDRSAESRCDEGFLRVARLRLRNRYDDGSSSAPYACDVLSRPGSDAVVAVLFESDGQHSVRVLLRDAPRAPIYLRKHKRFVHPDPREYRSILELVAGMVEDTDPSGVEGLRERAAIETSEEAGFELAPERFRALGGETFASPGTGDEKLFFCAARVASGALGDPAQLAAGAGDGSVMEELAQLVVMELGDAIAACREGAIPDMKTEIGLLRLADHLGYLPQLGCFASELPRELRDRYTPLGVTRRDAE